MFKKLGVRQSTSLTILKYTLSLLFVLIIGAIIILFQKENPAQALQAIVDGAFGSKINIGNTLRWSTPWILTSMAAILAFRSEVENYGIEGQMYVGALAAAVVGYSVQLPPALHVLVCMLAASTAGAFWALIPALLKLFLRIDELIMTLMMNYIAIKITEYITMWWIMGAQRSETGSDSITTPTILDSAKLTNLIPGTSLTTGLIIALVIAGIVFVLYRYTVKGYELKQIGDNNRFARVGGVKCNRDFFIIFLCSGLVAGLAGGIEVLGSYNRFIAHFSSGTTGWNGIMIAIICELSPIGCVFVSVIWGALTTGAMHMERITSLNRMTVSIIEMLFVLFVSIDYQMVYQNVKNFLAIRKSLKSSLAAVADADNRRGKNR